MEEHSAAGGMALDADIAYAIVIEAGETNYSAYAPDVPGCVAAGDTVEETIALMREALRLHFELMREDGEEIPKPRTRVVTVEVAPAA